MLQTQAYVTEQAAQGAAKDATQFASYQQSQTAVDVAV